MKNRKGDFAAKAIKNKNVVFVFKTLSLQSVQISEAVCGARIILYSSKY